MRTIDSRTQGLFLSGLFATHLRVTIDSQDMTDLEDLDWVEDAQIRGTIDKSVAVAQVSLVRRFAHLSLATLMSGSKLNANGVIIDLNKSVEIELAITPPDAPAQSSDWISVFKGQITKIDWSRSPIRCDCDDLGGVLERTFIETQRIYGSTSGTAVETIMQSILTDNGTGVTLYSENGTAGTPFQSSDSPGWLITKYKQSKQSVLAALRRLAQQIGWEVRYRYNDSVGDWVLTFYDPGRELRARGTLTLTGNPSATETFVVNATTFTAVASGATGDQFNIGADATETCDNIVSTLNSGSESSNLNAWRVSDTVVIEWGTVGTAGNSVTFTEAMTNTTADGGGTLGGTVSGRSVTTPDFTFDAETYESLSRMSVSLQEIRNAIKVVIEDDENDGIRTAVTREDSASITKHGRLYMEIQEASSSQIDTISEASTLANAALEDLKDPDAIAQVSGLGAFPWVELADVYTVEANGEHFDSDQTLSLNQYALRVAKSRAMTDLLIRGKPSVGLQRWFEVEGGRGAAPAVDEYSDDAPSNMAIEPSTGSIVVTFDDPRTMSPPITDWLYSACHVDTSSGFTPSETNLAARGRQTRFEIHGLVPGTTYYAKVIHYDDQGNVGSTSAQVSVATEKVGPYHSNEDREHGVLMPNQDFGIATKDLTVNPPDYWEEESGFGDWGSSDDIYFDTTDHQTGGRSIKMLGSSQTALADLHLLSEFFPVTAGNLYGLDTNVMVKGGTSPGVAAYVGIGIKYYDSAKSFLSNGTTATKLQSTMTAGTWYRVVNKGQAAPAGARYAKIVAAAGTTLAAGARDAYIDQARVFRFLPAFEAYEGSGQIIGTGAGWTTLSLDTETYDYGSNYNNTTYTFTAPEDGIYSISADIEITGLNTTAWARVGFYINATTRLPGAMIAGQSSPDLITHTVAALELQAGDTVVCQLDHNDPGSVTTTTNSYWSIKQLSDT
jgi:hypothetical protein